MGLVFRVTSLLLFIALFCGAVQSQTGEILSKKEIKNLEKEGEQFFEDQEYENAVKYFLQLAEISPSDPYYNLVIGICYTYNADKTKESLEYLEKAKALNPKFDQVDLYLGRAYYKNHQWLKSIETLEAILEKGSSDDITEAEARSLIRYCENALLLTADTIKGVRITNMGSVINTEDDEYAPLVTADETELIFTYRGKKSTGGKLNDYGEESETGRYAEDIMVSLKSPDDWMYDEDVWLDPEGLSQLNTDKDDASIALSIDGQTLFLYKYVQESGGDIYYSELDGKKWGDPKPIEGTVNTRNWEGSVSIASDGQVLYFSSDKPGGFGGRDLYRAEKMGDGTWGNVQNLGPSINTPLNDDSPFLHLDRKTLYFSSEGHNSMGGYDVFYAMNEDDEWVNVTNMGTPVNTIEDDMFYVANADGTKGYYSTAYGVGSQGKQDIYIVTPDVGRMEIDPVAALIVGIVFADDIPTGSEIVVRDITNNQPAGTFQSNNETGDYRIALLPGAKYELEVKVENYESRVDEIDLETLHEYIEVSNNIFVYSEAYAANNEIKENTPLSIVMAGGEETKEEIDETPVAIVVIPPVVKGKEEVVEKEVVKEKEVIEEKEAVAVVATPSNDPCDDMVDLSTFIGKDLNKEENYKDLLGEIGSYCADELQFKVQIGAYRFPKNFKYPHLNTLGNAAVKDYPDGITRFTMGEFITLKEADALRQEIIAAGTKDAWVIPFFDGQRIYMEDLISVNFYKQSVN